MKRLAAISGAILASAAPAKAHHGGDACLTRACDARVGHKKAAKKKRAAVRPYRGWLAMIRACESGGRWSTNTGNGFYGAYQFTLQSWAAVGGRGMPHLASPLEQSYRAILLLRLQGPNAWPVCSR